MMSDYMGRKLMYKDKQIGVVTQFSIEHPPPRQYISHDWVTGRHEAFYHQEGIPIATFEAEIYDDDINEFMEADVQGIMEREMVLEGIHGEQKFTIRGYVQDYKIEDGEFNITLERYKSWEEQEADRILAKLRSRGYMQ